MKKLTDLLTEIPNLDEQPEDSLLNALKNILRTWETKQYPDDKTRWEEYAMDIEELVEDFEENMSINRDDTNLAEQKLRKAIRKIIRQ